MPVTYRHSLIPKWSRTYASWFERSLLEPRNLAWDTPEAFHAGFGPHANEILADIPTHTDLTPVIQVSEIVGGRN